MQDYQFTASWAEFWPTDYEVEEGYDPFSPAPEVPNGFEAVPYLDQGYWGGVYWAVLPHGWTRESAQEIFDSEGHLNSLVDIGWHLVSKSHRPVKAG